MVSSSSKSKQSTSSAPLVGDAKDKKLDYEVYYEFGGPVGVFAIMIFSHCLMYYFWACLQINKGHMLLPHSSDDFLPFWHRMLSYVAEARPTMYAATIYFAFLLMQAIFQAWLPGPIVYGLPIPSEGNRKLPYRCNGVAAWYITLAVIAGFHYSGVFPLTEVIDHMGSLTTVAIICGNVISLLIYIGAYVFGKTHRMSGNFFYDFFMGAWLNPRIGGLDLKMWAEIRVAWIMLFLLTLSAAMKQYQLYGVVSTSMCLMVLAHFLYANACMKGEECIPTTWDIFYEKWGWMLIFWNHAGVPFVYCFQSMYILKHEPVEYSTLHKMVMFALLLGGYYIWDTANSQKNRFRMKLRGTYIPRKTFPQLPWGTLPDDCSYIKTEHGNALLTDGWYKYARKIHYTADIMMALSWGMACGFEGLLPYFYVCFFTGMISHRCVRDFERCHKKYGKDWEKYVKQVPYIFIPYVF
eukprot:GILJ01004102.1.p1 GENE.GILJ01004102.1~~GILJ01004102.1.p1  ORF type:complete len:465 (+),score=45.43 GILJ01004102.1:52-1446(+)